PTPIYTLSLHDALPISAPGMGRRLQEIQQRGGKVVLIDPRFNETAALADRHFFIKPGTDVLLLLALLHVVFEEALTRLGPLAVLDRKSTRLNSSHVSIS